MDRFKRRTSAPNLSLAVTKEIAKPSMARRQSDGLVKVQRSLTMPKYYIKGIDRETAEQLLMSKPAGTFLVRDRQSSDMPGLYTLSMRDKTNQCRHFKIDTHPHSRKLAIHGYPNQFESLEQLVEFFVDSQKGETKMNPFGQDALYEEMIDDISCYQEMEPCSVNPNIPKSLFRDDATLPGLSQVNYENINGKHMASDNPHTQPSYENIGNKKETRRPPPPSSWHNEIQSPHEMIDTLLHKKDTNPAMYQNIPPKNGALPLPPRRQSPMLRTTGRQCSLPSGYENISSGPPPPLPTRKHLNNNYQNVPGQGAGGRRLRQYHRSLTQPNAY